MDPTTQRLFIALNLPPELRDELHRAVAPLRDVVPARWTRADNLHLTLKFLGERPAGEIAPLTDALNDVATRHAPPRLAVGGVDAFPGLRRARVVWIGVEPDPKLELLQHDIETAGAALGYEMEGRPFRPHITLGRLREPERAQLQALARAARRIDFTRSTEAATLDLMRSEPGADGSTYTVIAAAPLAGGR